jgi:hypothetical protein
VSLSLALKLVPGLFSVELHTAKQLRHFKFTICTYLSSLLSSLSFVNQVASLSDEATHKMEPLYQDLIENMLMYIECVHHQHDSRAEQQTVKYWSVMLGLAYDILDKVQIFLFFFIVHQYLFEKVFNGIGFEVLTAIVMKNSVFWNIMLCGPLKVNLHFRRTCHLHLQG